MRVAGRGRACGGKSTESPDGRWRIEWECVKEFSAFFESETRYEIRVVRVSTNETFVQYYRDEFENSNGTQDSGVTSVDFAANGKTLIATFEDGHAETLVLPEGG